MLPLPARAWLEAKKASVEDFLRPDPYAIYRRCVRAAVADPRTVRFLGTRPGVTRERVQEASEDPRYGLTAARRCQGDVQDAFHQARADLAEAEDKHRSAAAAATRNWLITCLLLAAVGAVVSFAGGLLALAVAIWTAAVVLFVLARRRTALWHLHLRPCLLAAWWGAVWVLRRVRTGVRAARYGALLQEVGAGPVVAGMVRHMLGDDPDSVFVPDGFEGLRAPRAPAFLVENEAFRQMQRKLAHIQYGTIAVCGPRGAGKTTLLEKCVKEAPFGLLTQAPATYAPHDFLLSLSVRLCEKYLRSKGYPVPEFTRLSPVHRMLHLIGSRIRRLGRWSAFALPAGALLALGLSAPVRSLYTQYAGTLADFACRQARLAQDLATEIWQGQAVVAGLMVTLAGIAWWKSRHTAWPPRLVGHVWAWAAAPLGIGLALVSVASVTRDEQLIEQVHVLRDSRSLGLTPLSAMALGLLWCGLFALSNTGMRTQIRVGRRRICLESAARPLAAAAAVACLLVLVRNPQTYALLADPDNPLRFAGIVAGSLLARAGRWRPPPAEPELVTRCRNHLYRLQTTQTSSHALTTGASQMLSLGTSHTTSISTVPPNFPVLVDEFRALLERIAREQAESVQGKAVVIAIDEVDRLGSTAQALAFLSEIKAILGVPYVYYLISVAEDVGAAFVRRGLPHRDVTDSSLDDILHVQPSSLAESRTILTKRSETLTSHCALLAHALSGGVLRDLLRYGLQIKEMQEKSGSHELTEISRDLIMEELSETLAGFRTLLGQQQWSDDTDGILSSFRALCGYLRAPCPCTEPHLLQALADFAFSPDGARTRQVRAELADDARQLIDEAAAYAYFSLTLLDIFSTGQLDHRIRQAFDSGPDGEPERLAEARQELGISPHSARRLLNSIRSAWSLPLSPEDAVRPPHPTGWPCPVHGRGPLPS
ncbi:hypothetical protein DMH18_25560 [Streptomyces sp. WAC 06783]|uniref:orc1/cdc6 family replication initiation protein n=1 Tax=Streptomyces sp. WAC 06783 TaxID=2203211 RepID=UPI000F73863A|nr:orc1/cdc6 family replication initiation protein [Streptomyces sp. WAC 06783]RSO07307.1 hypothetical protein DMH18_25560 [Streptomyces sp. WAC 06783]